MNADDLIAESLSTGECVELEVESEEDELAHELGNACSHATKLHSKGGMDSILYKGEDASGEWSVRLYMADSV